MEKLSSKLTRLAHELSIKYYKTTLEFPAYERFCLADQLRRSLLSVSSNLNEGYSHYGDKQKLRFSRIAYASLSEAKYQMFFAYEMKYISSQVYESFQVKSEELSKLLISMIKALKK